MILFVFRGSSSFPTPTPQPAVSLLPPLQLHLQEFPLPQARSSSPDGSAFTRCFQAHHAQSSVPLGTLPITLR